MFTLKSIFIAALSFQSLSALPTQKQNESLDRRQIMMMPGLGNIMSGMSGMGSGNGLMSMLGGGIPGMGSGGDLMKMLGSGGTGGSGDLMKMLGSGGTGGSGGNASIDQVIGSMFSNKPGQDPSTHNHLTDHI